ncbi:flippase [Candidatus Falkowbacteria bacterium]|nr:flippase [Candidatus Falkowbacteria bacterium]
MPEKITNIAKNTSYFTLALILQKVISFTYFTLIARALGPEDLGKYYFAISFAAIFSILTDLGQTNLLTREIAKAKREANNLFGAVLGVKLPLAAATALIIIALANFLGYSELTRALIYFSTICIVLDSFTATFFSVSRGFHNLKYESLAAVVFQLIVLSFGLSVIKLNLGLVWLIGSLVLASIFNFSYSLTIVAKTWKLSLKPIFDWRLVKLVLRLSLPFGIYAIFQKVYSYFDTVLLATLAGDYYVGIYQISFKIINAIQFLPLAFVASLYPAMSAYWLDNRQQLAITFERAMNYLIIISLPISGGVIMLADKIILIFKSGYGEAILPLQLSIAALLFMFTAYPVGSLLNACDKQKLNTVIMGLTVLASVILNLILIPKFQAVGASLAVLLSSIFMLVLGLIQVPKIIEYRAKKILAVLGKSLLASALMIILIIYLKNYLNIILIVPLAGALYFAVLFFLKGFSREDLTSLYQSFNKKSIHENPTIDA